MMLLALDLATSCGWVLGTGAGDPRVGHIVLAGVQDGARGQKFSEFRKFLVNILDGFRETPTTVIFEAPLLPRPFIKQGRIVNPTKIETTTVLQGLAAIVELECHDRNIACVQTDVKTVKKELTGNGDATKQDMIRVAERVLGFRMKTSDEADAFGCWLVGVRHYAKQHAPEWDRRVWSGGRGALV